MYWLGHLCKEDCLSRECMRSIAVMASIHWNAVFQGFKLLNDMANTVSVCQVSALPVYGPWSSLRKHRMYDRRYFMYIQSVSAVTDEPIRHSAHAVARLKLRSWHTADFVHFALTDEHCSHVVSHNWWTCLRLHGASACCQRMQKAFATHLISIINHSSLFRYALLPIERLWCWGLISQRECFHAASSAAVPGYTWVHGWMLLSWLPDAEGDAESGDMQRSLGQHVLSMTLPLITIARQTGSIIHGIRIDEFDKIDIAYTC